MVRASPRLRVPRRRVPNPSELCRGFRLLSIPIFSIPLRRVLFRILHRVPSANFRFCRSSGIYTIQWVRSLVYRRGPLLRVIPPNRRRSWGLPRAFSCVLRGLRVSGSRRSFSRLPLRTICVVRDRLQIIGGVQTSLLRFLFCILIRRIGARAISRRPLITFIPLISVRACGVSTPRIQLFLPLFCERIPCLFRRKRPREWCESSRQVISSRSFRELVRLLSKFSLSSTLLRCRSRPYGNGEGNCCVLSLG